MSKAITKFKGSNHCTNTWIAIGDTVNDREIQEIWCSSAGTPIFTINNKQYSRKELFEILPEGEDEND